MPTIPFNLPGTVSGGPQTGAANEPLDSPLSRVPSKGAKQGIAQRVLRMADPGPPEVLSNRRFDKPETVLLTLPGESYVYDLRAARTLGTRK